MYALVKFAWLPSWDPPYHPHGCWRSLRGIPVFAYPNDHSVVDGLQGQLPGEKPMHDVLIALAFIGMVLAPAIVAADANLAEERE